MQFRKVQSPPFSFSSDVLRLHPSRSFSHEKKSPPIPPSPTIFTIAPNISSEALLIQTSETLASLNAMTIDLAFELEGSNHHKLLATQQLIVLSGLLVERMLDTQMLTHAAQPPPQ